MTTPPEPRRYLSEVLYRLVTEAGERISIAQLLATFGDRASGGCMLLLAAPNILPLPPGSASVLSIPLMFIAAQLALGRRILWLPRAIMQRSFRRQRFQAIAGRLLPKLARIEWLFKPRLSFMLGIMQDRFIGLACLLLALLMFLPIPLGNVLPALAISAFALGLLERDGMLVILGWLVTALCAVFFGAVFGYVWRLLRNLSVAVLGG